MNNIEIYTTQDGQTEIEVKFQEDTVWLTQSQISELFLRDRTVITKHINNVFKEGELNEKSNVQKMHFANSDKPVNLYNLDVIISVGYRVNSKRGKQFGSFLFVWFLEQNKHRFKKSGEVKINDNALIALALLVAQSDPNDKDLMIKLICNLIQE
jgi:hypothetical protein